MSYISAKRVKDNILVWERTDGKRSIRMFDAPYYLYTKNENGNYKSMYGDNLERHDYINSKEFFLAKREFEKNKKEMFESDIPPELKLLSREYYKVPPPNLNVTFLDIEVDYDPTIGFSSVVNPYAPINSIAFYHRFKKEYVLLAIPPNYADRDPTNTHFVPGTPDQEFVDQLNEISELPKDINLKIIFFQNERTLLQRLLKEIKDSDVLSGWNSDFFDVPYMCKRIELILGRSALRKMSFEQGAEPTYREVDRMGMTSTTVDLDGRISADYMDLFKKYEVAERPSYKLESIADEVLPDLPKLEYEGSLATLYRSNFVWFVRYNLRDTEILEGFEQRLGYVEVANGMYHMSTGLFKHVTGTLKLAELATINECHHELNNLIVNDNIMDGGEGSIQGAFVLLPQVGLHEQIGSVDLNSLYPGSIRSVNISPETLLGQFVHTHLDAAGFLDTTYVTKQIASQTDEPLTISFDNTSHVPVQVRGLKLEATAKEWNKILKQNKWAISGYGTVFNQEKQGIIPMILESWYAKRKEYQRQKQQSIVNHDKLGEAYNDRLQYIYKIKLNSFYGALTNAYFRFYDLRLGESTTGTGRLILIHQCAKACEFLDGQYQEPDREIIVEKVNKKTKEKEKRVHFGYTDKWSVVYGDTDSSYFSTKTNDIESATKKADTCGEYVNDSFPEFMKYMFSCTEGFNTIMKTGREIISDRGIFVDKKRYILHIVNNEGKIVDKLKVMGLDTKKTTLPKEIATKINSFVGRYLKGETWKDLAVDIVEYKSYLETTKNVMEIGLPKGVKKVEYYTKELKENPNPRLPGHVRASIFYNMLLDLYKDTKSMRITSGMKIKVFYITNASGKFKAIAIPVDIEEVPEWFLKNFSIDRAMHTERLVDKPLNNIIKAIGEESPSKQSLFADDCLEY